MCACMHVCARGILGTMKAFGVSCFFVSSCLAAEASEKNGLGKEWVGVVRPGKPGLS